jgi:hypothetical protein
MERMTTAQARELNAQGKLNRKVMTEEGWYIPTPRSSVSPPIDPPAPRILPPTRSRKPRKAKGAE